jgi:hypothetical protein
MADPDPHTRRSSPSSRRLAPATLVFAIAAMLGPVGCGGGDAENRPEREDAGAQASPGPSEATTTSRSGDPSTGRGRNDSDSARGGKSDRAERSAPAKPDRAESSGPAKPKRSPGTKTRTELKCRREVEKKRGNRPSVIVRSGCRRVRRRLKDDDLQQAPAPPQPKKDE